MARINYLIFNHYFTRTWWGNVIESRNGVSTVYPRGVKLWNNGMPIIDGTFVTLRVNTNTKSNINYAKRREFEKI